MDARFLINGDCAITIQIADDISIPNSRKVTAMKCALEADPIPGVVELLPTYCALTVYYRPEIITYQDLVTACKARLERINEQALSSSGNEKILEVPALYGGEWGYDLPEVAAYHNMTERQIIDIHTGYPFYTYMLGFTPGHGYLGSENPLKIPRRSSPRLCVERGCIVVVQNLSIIEPIDSPNGWNVIAKTPLRVFDLDKEDPFMIKQGMWVQFREIDREEYDAIDAEVKAGRYVPKITVKEG